MQNYLRAVNLTFVNESLNEKILNYLVKSNMEVCLMLKKYGIPEKMLKQYH